MRIFSDRSFNAFEIITKGLNELKHKNIDEFYDKCRLKLILEVNDKLYVVFTVYYKENYDITLTITPSVSVLNYPEYECKFGIYCRLYSASLTISKEDDFGNAVNSLLEEFYENNKMLSSYLWDIDRQGGNIYRILSSVHSRCCRGDICMFDYRVFKDKFDASLRVIKEIEELEKQIEEKEKSMSMNLWSHNTKTGYLL